MSVILSEHFLKLHLSYSYFFRTPIIGVFVLCRQIECIFLELSYVRGLCRASVHLLKGALTIFLVALAEPEPSH